MADRTTALEAWLGTVVEKGAPHKLRDGGPAAVSIVGKAARAIVEEDGGHASPKACAPGGEWGQAKQLARKFSEAAYERWPITTNPTGAEATAAVEILLYCAACCDKSSKRGAYIQRILRLPQAQQQQLMGAMKAQMAAEREAQSGQRKPLDAVCARRPCIHSFGTDVDGVEVWVESSGRRVDGVGVELTGRHAGEPQDVARREAPELRAGVPVAARARERRPRGRRRAGPRRGARGLRPRQGRGARRPRGAGRARGAPDDARGRARRRARARAAGRGPRARPEQAARRRGGPDDAAGQERDPGRREARARRRS